MSHVRVALLGTLALVLTVMLAFVMVTSTPTPAQAEGEGCTLTVEGQVALVICGDEQFNVPLPEVTVAGPTVVEEVTLPPVTVTLPPLPAETEFVRIPGPTKTVTLRPANSTETVFVPEVGPTQTATVYFPGPTVTRFVAPRPQPTVTDTVTDTVTVTETETSVVEVTRQPRARDDTMGPGEDFDFPGINLGDDNITIVEVGISTLTLLALVGLLLLVLYAGYALGYKDKERKDTNFMGALLDASKLRRTSQ